MLLALTEAGPGGFGVQGPYIVTFCIHHRFAKSTRVLGLRLSRIWGLRITGVVRQWICIRSCAYWVSQGWLTVHCTFTNVLDTIWALRGVCLVSSQLLLFLMGVSHLAKFLPFAWPGMVARWVVQAIQVVLVATGQVCWSHLLPWVRMDMYPTGVVNLLLSYAPLQL